MRLQTHTRRHSTTFPVVVTRINKARNTAMKIDIGVQGTRCLGSIWVKVELEISLPSPVLFCWLCIVSICQNRKNYHIYKHGSRRTVHIHAHELASRANTYWCIYESTRIPQLKKNIYKSFKQTTKMPKILLLFSCVRCGVTGRKTNVCLRLRHDNTQSARDVLEDTQVKFLKNLSGKNFQRNTFMKTTFIVGQLLLKRLPALKVL